MNKTDFCCSIPRIRTLLCTSRVAVEMENIYNT